jgi:galactokinase
MLSPLSKFRKLAAKVLPPKIARADIKSPELKALVEEAKALYKEKLGDWNKDHSPPAFVVCAPGRVNLIGEHTDYTGGYVMPFAIDRWVVIYGTGFVHTTGKGQVPSSAKLHMVSSQSDKVVEERTLTASDNYEPPEEGTPLTWPAYVAGTVAQYMADLNKHGCVVNFALAITSNVPLGAGLSSSAALEVATATFLECFWHGDLAYASASDDEQEMDRKVVRALRCQKAENEWAHCPCGIMDQLASSCAEEDQLMLIDCRSMEITYVPVKKDTSDQQPVILVTNSKVEHEIADSEYGLRRKECHDALEAMQQVPLYHVLSLRDATLQDVETAKDIMGEIAYNRAKHVVTENSRTMECKTALKLGLWERVGELMNASHKSLKEMYEVSCDEVNFLVDICQEHPGVYGSRITGGGFGGCIVTLVQKDHVNDLINKLNTEYMECLGKECDSFVVHPSFGARVLAIDLDCK